MSSLIKILRFLVYGNFYVSLAAGLLALETKLIFNIHFTRIFHSEFILNDFHFLMVFCLTFSAYNFQRLVKVKDKANKGFIESKKGFFFHKNFFILLLLSGLSVLWVIMQISKVSIFGIILLGFCGIISFLYVQGIKILSMPSLRSLPYVKIFMIAMVWTLICGLFPIISNVQFPDGLVYYLIALSAFLFAITIPFDIRDVEVDKANNLITFPVKFGEERCKLLSYFVLIIYIAIIFLFQLRDQIKLTHAAALILSACVAAFTIFFSKKERPEFFFSVLVEGLMVLQFLLVLIADFIFG